MSTDLTKELVTDQLRSTSQDKLKKLEFNHLTIKIEAAVGPKDRSSITWSSYGENLLYLDRVDFQNDTQRSNPH